MKLTKCLDEVQSVGNDFYIHRLSYGEDSWILSQENKFWQLPFETRKELIKPFLEEYKGFRICWVEEYEANYLEGPVGDDIQPNIPFFQKLGLDVTYMTNAMGGLGYKKLKHESISYWIGKNSWKNASIPEQRDFTKSFLYMNRIRKRWREKFFWEVYTQRLTDDCEWSWAADNQHDPLHKSIEGIPIENENNHLEMELLPQFNTTFCSVVPETFFSNDGVSNQATFITEKTEKCFAVGHPFIIVSTPYFLQNLRELGFKTFDMWWDESYDNCEDSKQRVDLIINIMHEISGWSMEYKKQVYREMISTLKHNQSHNKKLLEKYQTAGKNWLEFNGDFNFYFGKKPKDLI